MTKNRQARLSVLSASVPAFHRSIKYHCHALHPFPPSPMILKASLSSLSVHSVFVLYFLGPRQSSYLNGHPLQASRYLQYRSTASRRTSRSDSSFPSLMISMHFTSADVEARKAIRLESLWAFSHIHRRLCHSCLDRLLCRHDVVLLVAHRIVHILAVAV